MPTVSPSLAYHHPDTCKQYFHASRPILGPVFVPLVLFPPRASLIIPGIIALHISSLHLIQSQCHILPLYPVHCCCDPFLPLSIYSGLSTLSFPFLMFFPGLTSLLFFLDCWDSLYHFDHDFL